MNKLMLCKFKFTLRFLKNTFLPTFVGNTIRGALGQALYENSPNAYRKVFKVEAENSIPNSFVLSTPYPGKGAYQVGDTLDFTITLFGLACCYDREILSAVRLMCTGKLSDTELIAAESVYDREWSDDSADSLPFTDALTLHFHTPTEILSSKVPVTELDFAQFINCLFGRISGVIDHYSDGEFVIPFALVAAKPYIRAAYQLKQTKFQTNGQPICGFTGTIRYFGEVTRYLPYIDLGSQLHIGKKATRSCGEYSFEL